MKKDGSTLMTKDIAEVIYSDPNLKAEDLFVELHHSQFFTTLIAIVHKSKIDQFKMTYEKLLKGEDASAMPVVVPNSCRYLGIEDKEGNQLFRFVVMSNQVDNYMAKARQENFSLRKFVYDYEKYKADLHQRTVLETNFDQ